MKLEKMKKKEIKKKKRIIRKKIKEYKNISWFESCIYIYFDILTPILTFFNN